MNKSLYIVWNDRNDFGIPIIDEQHRGIISTINSLHYYMKMEHVYEIITPVMITLQQYTDIHFRTEEELMAKAEYDEIEKHIIHHRGIAAEIKRVWIEFNKDKDADKILVFLKDWWLNHINKEDRKYVPCLKKL